MPRDVLRHIATLCHYGPVANIGIIVGSIFLSAVALLNLAVLAYFLLRVWRTHSKPRQRPAIAQISKPQVLAPAHH